MLTLLCFLSGAIDLLVDSIFYGVNVRLLACPFVVNGLAFRIKLSFELSKFFSFTDALEPVTLPEEIFAQRTTVLQLAIQRGEGVLGEISDGVASCYVGLRS